MMGSRVRVTQAAPIGLTPRPRSRNSLEFCEIKLLAFLRCHTTLLHNGSANHVSSHHLIRRGGVWHYRRRVHQDLISAIGKKGNQVLAEDRRTRGGQEASRGRGPQDNNAVRTCPAA